MSGWVMFCDIIAQILFSVFPIDVKLTLADSVAQPAEAHVHCFGHALLDGFVGEACCTFVVELEECGTLRVSEFF